MIQCIKVGWKEDGFAARTSDEQVCKYSRGHRKWKVVPICPTFVIAPPLVKRPVFCVMLSNNNI